MASNPLISIITPSFNQAQYLEKTINSVITQNYPNIEYIIIDGGSTDGSVDIIKKYGDRISYWVSEKDRGQSYALNKGFKKATGDIVAWINSDDMYEKNTVSKIAQYFMDNPDIDLVYGNCEYIDSRGRRLFIYRSRRFDLKALIGTDYIPQPTVFFRKGLLEEVGYIDESLHYTMDYDLWLKFSLKYKMAYIDDVLAKYRLHDVSKTISQGYKFHYDQLVMWDMFSHENISDEITGSLIDKMLSLVAKLHLEQLYDLNDYIRQKYNTELISDTDYKILEAFFKGEGVSDEKLNEVFEIANKYINNLIKVYAKNNRYTKKTDYSSLLINYQIELLYDDGKEDLSRKIFLIYLKRMKTRVNTSAILLMFKHVLTYKYFKMLLQAKDILKNCYISLKNII